MSNETHATAPRRSVYAKQTRLPDDSPPLQQHYTLTRIIDIAYSLVVSAPPRLPILEEVHALVEEDGSVEACLRLLRLPFGPARPGGWLGVAQSCRCCK